MKVPSIVLFLLSIMWGTAVSCMENKIFSHQNIEHCLFEKHYVDKKRGSEPKDRAPSDEEFVSELRSFFSYERHSRKAAQGIFDEIIFHVEDSDDLIVFLNRIFKPIIQKSEEPIRTEDIYATVYLKLAYCLRNKFGCRQVTKPKFDLNNLPLYSYLEPLKGTL